MRKGARMPRAVNASWTVALTPSASKDSDICSLLGLEVPRLLTRNTRRRNEKPIPQDDPLPSVVARLAEKLRAHAVGVRIARMRSSAGSSGTYRYRASGIVYGRRI